MNADRVETFLLRRKGRLDAASLAALKHEVDRLLGSNLERAAHLVKRLEELAALTKEAAGAAFANAARARLLDHQGNHAAANQFYETAVKQFRAVKLPCEAAILQRQQLRALMFAGRFSEARQVARQARKVLTRTDAVELAQLEANLGALYYRQDRYKEALRYYNKAQQIIATVKDRAMRALLNFNRATIFLATDRPDEAKLLLESAARDFQRAHQEVKACQARFELAYLDFKRGNYNKALADYYQLRDRLDALGSHELAAFCSQDIAEILLALNAFEDAQENARQARRRFLELGSVYEAAQAATLDGLASARAGNFKHTAKRFREARAAFAQSGNVVAVALADCYAADLALRRGESGEAAKLAAAACLIFSRRRLLGKAALARLLLARALHQQGKLREAQRYAKAALKAGESISAVHLVWQAHHLLGRIASERGNRQTALAEFRQAVALIESASLRIADDFKSSFLDDKLTVYEDAISAYLDEGDDNSIAAAFRLVEASKSRALADLLRRVPPALSKRGNSATRLKFLQLLEELHWYAARLHNEDEKGERRSVALVQRYQQRLAKREKQIAQLFRRLAIEEANVEARELFYCADADALRQSLAADETAIEYFMVGDTISAFVVRRDQISLARAIASRREVEAQLTALHFQLEKFALHRTYLEAHCDQLQSASAAHLTALYEALFEPLELLIDTAKLIVIPHGSLHAVPFAALTDGTVDLLDAFEISVAPSATVFRLCREKSLAHCRTAKGGRRRDRVRLVACGVTTNDTPCIADEITALSNLFANAVTLTGAEATRAALLKQASRADLLHIACHGRFKADNPRFSFLQLADAPLNYYGLLDLELHAQLVTLSACQTGVTAITAGDELHGLMRGFLAAGAPSLIVSLWSVNDRSTTDLMSEMYARLQAGATKREALRAAQLQVKRRYPHPYYWAAFVLLGNPV